MAGLFSGEAARRRKRQPGRSRSLAKTQLCGQRQFGVDERGKGRLNTRCKSKTMKTKICLLGIFALVSLAIAAPHTWTFQKGGTFEGDYYSSGTTAVVVRKNGTNYIFKIADLSTNDLAYVAKVKADQKQAQLDAEVKQMTAAGMIEFSDKLLEKFPERVDRRAGWMDVVFGRLTTGYGVIDGRADSATELGLSVTDKNGDSFDRCVAQKWILGPNFMSGDNSDQKPNPFAPIIENLKNGDRIRLIGTAHTPAVSEYRRFDIERIEIIETAAEKKAREQAAEKP
jgi:hypothetical protein